MIVLVGRIVVIIGLLFNILGCENKDKALNDPYPNEPLISNTYYSSFAERPKHLDPARSYSSGEWTFISQIYEPVLEYHYLKRPYELIPLLSKAMPVVRLFDKDGEEIKSVTSNSKVEFTTYDITIKSGVRYQPHPAFAKNRRGLYLYHNLSLDEISKYKELSDFTETDSRELVAEDFVYQIKRLADPKINSPIYGFINYYIEGLAELRKELLLNYNDKKTNKDTINLRDYNLPDVKVINKYHYRIKVKGNYPQFKYWLAMPFFAPVPWEAVSFYNQPGMSENNITLDWYPVGTGPYMLSENNPERRMVMLRNPNFREQQYPTIGEVEDKEKGLLEDSGKNLPFIDKMIFSLEKENIPYWNKFLQGYYDSSGISSDNFNNAIDATPSGTLNVSKQLQDKNISLQTTVAATIMYWSFNMLDQVVGGYSENAIKLRQAITIAFDVEEFISIFLNGRGISAQSPIPPGILGHDLSFNEFVYQKVDTNKLKRKSLLEAKKLLSEAGFPNGRDKKTGEQLVINFEAISSGDPDEKAVFLWLRKQLSKLNIELVIRATDYNRFREKMNNGDGQMFFWGWNADYPDPENFLFMFYGPNGKAKHGGENAANYNNPKFDELFETMRAMGDGDDREKVIYEMVQILQREAPWVWGYHPQNYSLSHSWKGITKPNSMARNTLKYMKINPELRAKQQQLWNKPIFWPVWIVGLVLVIVVLPAWISFKKREYSVAKVM